MSLLELFISDVFYGIKDSLSGWIVALKCWKNEAKKISTKPKAPKGLAEITRKRQEAKGIKIEDKEGTLFDVLWNTVTTAGVALLITFLIQTVCSYLVSLCGEHFENAIALSGWVLQALWWFPSMMVIKLTSIINNNEVSDKVFMYKYGKPKYTPIGAAISELVFSSIYQLVFLVQACVVVMIIPWPWVAVCMEWLHYALFYSLYAFEYKWTLLGIAGHTRVAQIENNWLYYFSFGLPIHLATAYWSSLYTRTMAFTLLFPFCILGSTVSSPPRSQFLFPVHIMFPSVYVTNEMYKVLHHYFGKNKPSTSGTQPSTSGTQPSTSGTQSQS